MTTPTHDFKLEDLFTRKTFGEWIEKKYPQLDHDRKSVMWMTNDRKNNGLEETGAVIPGHTMTIHGPTYLKWLTTRLTTRLVH